jgi:exopolysaccharide production protein ExoZ
MKTLVSVQYLRALAALAVAAFHALQWLRGGFEIGRAGVDVFFVISGVIMWRITAGRAVSPASFVWRRFTRVAPAYWLATLVVAAVAGWSPLFLAHVHPTWRHLALSLAFLPHHDPEGLPFPLLAPGWTLIYEAAFYLLFAASLMAKESARAIWATAGLAAVAGAGFLYPPAYGLGANPLMLEFAAGLWIGKLSLARALPGRGWAIALLTGGLGALAGEAASGYVNELWRPLLWGVPSAMIVAGAVSLESRGAALTWPALKSLGDASYSLYLWHLPVIALVAHLLAARQPWLFLPAAIVATIAAAFAGRAIVEKPAIALLRRASPARPAASLQPT